MSNYLFDLPFDLQIKISQLVHRHYLMIALNEMSKIHWYSVLHHGRRTVRIIKKKTSDMDLFKKERDLVGKPHINILGNIWPNIDHTVWYYDRVRVVYLLNPSGQLDVSYTPCGSILDKVHLNNKSPIIILSIGWLMLSSISMI